MIYQLLKISSILTLVLNFAYGQKVGVVLSGGGANGLAHIGVLEALEEEGIEISYITGTSAGAFIGALYASGYSPKEIKQFVLSDKFQLMSTGGLDEDTHFYLRQEDKSASILTVRFNTKNLLKKALPTNFITPALLDYEMLKLLGTQSAARYNDFDSLFIPFRCVASDIRSKKSVVFSNGNLNEAVRASMTYPFYLNPIRIDSVLYFDGGLYNNFPSDVIYNNFDVDYIIGSNVSYNAQPPEEDDLAGQLVNMLVTPSNFSLPCSNGILIEPETGVSTFDFLNAEKAMLSGYTATMQKIDSIKLYVKNRITTAALNKKRKQYARLIPTLKVQDIKAETNEGNVIEFVEKSFRQKEILEEKELESKYFRTYTTSQIKYLYPTLSLNKNGSYDLNVKVQKQRPIQLDIGGHLSSRAVNTGYIGVRYLDISKAAVDFGGSVYFGKFYGSIKLDLNIDVPTKVPFKFTPYFVINRWDYFKNFATFFEEVQPSFLVQNETYYGAKFSFPMSNNIVSSLDFRLFDLEDQYYQTDNFVNSDTTDVTNFEGQSANFCISKNSQNNKQWASHGEAYKIQLRYVEGRETSISGSTAPFDYEFRKAHNWINLEAEYDNFLLNTKRFKLGYQLNGVFNSQSLFANYTASILSTTAYSPTPDSRTYFLSDYRAPIYAGAGLHIILPIKTNFEFRIDPYIYQPFKRIVKLDEGKFEYQSNLKQTSILGSASLIFNSPVGPIRFTANYFPELAEPWSLQFSYGYVIFNERAIR